jgi:xylan 1,4-beta-xylosidase
MPLPSMPRRDFLGALLALPLPATLAADGPAPAEGEKPLRLTADFATPAGPWRALHGVNKGPLAPGGLVNVIESHRAARIPWTRLHDCHWPYPDVVDMHVVFPNPSADPEREESYEFARTDAYLAAIREAGSGIVYRLGETIEHEPVKRNVHPPKDQARWAQACLGVIRHYNEGWARGFRHGIPYWEIWNEPENQPACWTGTDDEYFNLYRVTSRVIKERFPALKVGGPALGGTGQIKNGKFEPSTFLTRFLKLCQQETLPLDFFSWHCYTDRTSEITVRAHAMRALLDAHGFTKAESHLNEWNYLPDNSWNALSRKAAPAARQQAYDKMSGPHGAAFLAATLIELQDTPLDVANFFHGEIGACGLFSEQGVPMPNYHALRAFADLLATPQRVRVEGGVAGRCVAAAGMNAEKNRAAVLVSNYTGGARQMELRALGLPWKSGGTVEMRTIDARQPEPATKRQTLAAGEAGLTLDLPAPGVALLVFQPAN